MDNNNQIGAYFLPLFSLAIVLIVVGVVVIFLEPGVGIWFLLCGLLILAFLWYSINISIPRAESRRNVAGAAAEEAKKKEADIVKDISAARESHGLTDPRAIGRYDDQARRDFVAAGVLKLNAKKGSKAEAVDAARGCSAHRYDGARWLQHR
jgi:ABC-type transport system involved in Fe-S cluster assembly fused permease/ATPase subunit